MDKAFTASEVKKRIIEPSDSLWKVPERITKGGWSMIDSCY